MALPTAFLTSRKCSSTLISSLFQSCSSLSVPSCVPATTALLKLPCLVNDQPKRFASSLHGEKEMNPLKRKFTWVEHYNKIKLPPQTPDEPRRPAQVFHMRAQLRGNLDRAWYLSNLIRFLTIDEAIKQLSFSQHKIAHEMKEVLLEAQERAVKEQNFEYKSDMWVAESNVHKGVYVQGMRNHARGRFGIIMYKWVHFKVKLQEGKPEKYWPTYYPTKGEVVRNYVDKLRSRKIQYAD